MCEAGGAGGHCRVRARLRARQIKQLESKSSVLCTILVRTARIIAPLACVWQRRHGFRVMAGVCAPAFGAGGRQARPVAAAGRTAARPRRILARSLGSEIPSMKIGRAPRTFQELIFTLQHYWSEQGCIILQPYDMEVGAGTFHTATFLRAVGPEPWRAAYVQPSRRTTAGRYGEKPFRLQHYYQYQVVIKPSPLPILDLYLASLAALGLDPLVHDVRFVEDNWESPTLGAWGLGWEVWLNGMEITQFTYFQQVGGLDCRPVTGEITYGLERLAMYLQGVESIYDILWSEAPSGRVTYGDVFHQNEVEQSAYNFEHADVPMLMQHFEDHAPACQGLLAAGLALPAYEQVLKASHTFNLLDARRAISVTERQRYILRVRTLASAVARAYLESRAALGFPLLKPVPPAAAGAVA